MKSATSRATNAYDSLSALSSGLIWGELFEWICIPAPAAMRFGQLRVIILAGKERQALSTNHPVLVSDNWSDSATKITVIHSV